VVGIESRGFVFAHSAAQQLGAGFIPMRTSGTVPGPTVSRPYGLAYGTDELEVRSGACAAGSRVLIVDDVLATGGTALVAAELMEAIRASVVGFSFLATLDALGGGRRLQDYQIRTLLRL